MSKAVLALSLFAVSSLLAASGNAAAGQTSFKLCKSTYALCTSAECTSVPGKEGTVSCTCDVKTGWSAGQERCQEKEASEGKELRSRYFPVKSVAVCSNDRPWAWCLDKPCIVDKNAPTKAACACTVVKDQGPYVIGAETYNEKICTTGIISSATVTQITQVTDFLKKKKQFSHIDLKFVNK
ncbi:MAG: hypothetical protein ACREDM_04175 [Methylocella sp.]